MLTIEDLDVRYGKSTALRGVSLRVDAGEIVSLIGPNGAGKSTTLSAILGLVAATRGRITLDGETLIGRAPEAIARAGIALVPEGRQIFATLTVRDNLLLGATARRDRAAILHDIEALTTRFPILATTAATLAGKLSGGEQQQLAIARALISKPRLLLLDEPSLGLAPKIVDSIFHLLAELRDEGITILLVEQNARRAARLADRTYVLRTGRITLSATRSEIGSMADLESAFLGI